MLYIIPDVNNLEEYKKYNLPFQFNDFYKPEILDDPDLLEKRIEEYKKLDNHNNTMHGAFFDISLSSFDNKIRRICEKRCKQSLELCERLGCRAIIFHTNYIDWIKDRGYRDMWLSLNKKFYLSMLKKYKNIEIYVENMFDNEPYMLRDLCKAINHPRFGACLDIAHAALSDTAIGVWINILGPYIKHVQINDNDMIRDAHLPLGDGIIDYKEVFNNLNACGSFNIVIDVNGIDGIDKSLEYLNTINKE